MNARETTEELCACGEALHYSQPDVRRKMERLVQELGPTVVVRTSAGGWRVPRHYIALHGLMAEELPALAAKYGWKGVAR